MIHGGDVYTDGILKGKELLDYSSNINPLGVPESFKKNIHKSLNALVRYPDIQYRELKTCLGEYLDTDTKNIFLGNGAAEILDLCECSLKNIVICAPSFSEYELNAKKWGINIDYSYLIERKTNKYHKSYVLDYDYKDILKKLECNEGLIIANPNNPNGSLIDKEEFKEILKYSEDHNKIIIIDEAFIEFASREYESFVSEVENYKCLMVVRALTKFYGMPGIRFGYGITSNHELKSKLEERQNPWNINVFAEEAAKIVIFDEEYISKTYNWLEEERTHFEEKLNQVEVLEKVYSTNGNYFLCQSKLSAQDIYERMKSKGILVRKADNYEGLSSNHIRIALKDRENNRKFLEAIKHI